MGRQGEKGATGQTCKHVKSRSVSKTAEQVTRSESVFRHIGVRLCGLLSVSMVTVATPPGKFRVTVAQRGGKQ